MHQHYPLRQGVARVTPCGAISTIAIQSRDQRDRRAQVGTRGAGVTVTCLGNELMQTGSALKISACRKMAISG